MLWVVFLNKFFLAQERQENVQKIILEGTERMEDQVYADCILSNIILTACICVKLMATFVKALGTYRVSLNGAFMEVYRIN